MTMQDVHKIVAARMKRNFTAEDMQLIKRALEAHRDAQATSNVTATWSVQAIREWEAADALLTRIK